MTSLAAQAPIAAILLAAGEAQRMGRPKQLLPFENGTLLTHAIDTAERAQFNPLIVVLGAQAEAVEKSIAAKQVQIVRNPGWQAGMGSSISTGVKHLQKMTADSLALAILLGDQPRVTERHLEGMRKKFLGSDAVIVAAEYKGSLGVPAIFGRLLFERLASLKPDAGAKSILSSPEFKIESYQLPEAAIDIDTPEDFAAL